jgi:hypothetical protein
MKRGGPLERRTELARGKPIERQPHRPHRMVEGDEVEGRTAAERRFKRRGMTRHVMRSLEDTQRRHSAAMPRKPMPKTTKSPTDFTPQARALMMLRSGGWCEWVGCRAQATDAAHRSRRTRSNGHAANGLMLCREHHAWCHAHSDDAREVYGAMLHSTADPTKEGVLTRHYPTKILLNNAPDAVTGALWRPASAA